MRRAAVSLALVLGTLTLFAGLGSATAAAAGTKKLIEGTVFDATCGVACSPCPPPCGGPIPAPQSRSDLVCAQPQAQRQIVCPLSTSAPTALAPDFCIQGEPCGVDYPVYSGEGAVVTLRKRGAKSFLAKIAVVEGHFRVRVSPGVYTVRPYLPEPQCWSGLPVSVKITPKLKSPVPAALEVTDSCAVHPDAAG